MNKICCLTVLYNGRELPETTAGMIAALLMNSGVISNTDQCTIIYKDSEAIANAVLAAEQVSSISIPLNNDSSSQEKIVAAVAHIGKYFAEDISKCKKTRDYTPFALHLIVECDRDHTIHKSVEVKKRQLFRLPLHILQLIIAHL